MPVVPMEQQAQLLDAQWQQEQRKKPTPEHILMAAADMHARGQLIDGPTTYGSPGADMKLPFLGGGKGPRQKKRK